MTIQKTVKRELAAIINETFSALLDSYQMIDTGGSWKEYCSALKDEFNKGYNKWIQEEIDDEEDN